MARSDNLYFIISFVISQEFEKQKQQGKQNKCEVYKHSFRLSIGKKNSVTVLIYVNMFDTDRP